MFQSFVLFYLLFICLIQQNQPVTQQAQLSEVSSVNCLFCGKHFAKKGKWLTSTTYVTMITSTFNGIELMPRRETL